MAYVGIYPKWLPYDSQADTRGFIVHRFGNACNGVDSVCNAYAGEVCAVIAGTVLSVREDRELGQLVEYGTERVRILYGYLAEVTVQPGEIVRPGEVLGVEGASGNAKSKHLRVMMWLDGHLVDPEPYLCGKMPFPTGEPIPVPQPKETKPAPQIRQNPTVDELREIRARIDALLTKLAAES